MYEYLKGFITQVTPQFVVVEVGGIGYRLSVADPYHYQVDASTEVTVYIHQVVTDSFQALYGFADATEKQLFEKLINVSGIGPKSAIAIMAGNQGTSLVNAINEENVTFLTKFPGVGKKTAKQIVLDLKGKLDDLMPSPLLEPESMGTVEPDSTNQALSDALDALNALGYPPRDVKKVKTQLLKSDAKMDTNQYLSAGLKILTQL